MRLKGWVVATESGEIWDPNGGEGTAVKGGVTLGATYSPILRSRALSLWGERGEDVSVLFARGQAWRPVLTSPLLLSPPTQTFSEGKDLEDTPTPTPRVRSKRRKCSQNVPGGA